MEENAEKKIPTNKENKLSITRRRMHEKTPLCPETSPPDTAETEPTSRKRLVRTCCMAPIYLSLGLYGGLLSPAIPDLQTLLQCNVAQISLAVTPKAIGIMCGSIGGAVVSDHYLGTSDIWLFLASSVAGLMNVLLPWAPNIPILGTLNFVLGCAHGVANVICCAVTLTVWGQDAKVPLNYIHLFQTIGVVVAPLVAGPFLLSDYTWQEHLTRTSDQIQRLEDDDVSMNYVTVNGTTNQNVHSGIPPTSVVYIPFAIYGVIGIISGIPFLIIYLSAWKFAPHEKPTNSAPGGELQTKEQMAFTAFVSITVFFIYTSMLMRDKPLGLFSFYIAIHKLGMSKNRAVLYNTVFAGTWVIGGAIGTLILAWVRVHWLVFLGGVLTLLTNISIYFYALETELFFWILTCALGIWCGPCYACLMAWLNQYVHVGGVLLSIIELGLGMGTLIATPICGYILYNFGVKAIFLQSIIGTTTMLIVVVFLQVVFILRGDEHTHSLQT